MFYPINSANYREAVKYFSKLTDDEKQQFIAEICFPSNTSQTLDQLVTQRRFSKGRFCPHCGDKHVVRNGTRKNKTQKYLCRNCHKNFTATTNTVLAGSHKDQVTWDKFIQCVINSDTLRESADKCGINKNTAFEWRHKVMETLCTNMSDNIVLDGIIEADETFFRVSYKGSRHMPRPPHKRGSSIHTRGLSREQVCVYTSVNRNGRSIAKAGNVGPARKKKMHEILDGRLEPGSYLCTDGLRAYSDIAKTNNLVHIPIKGGRTRKGIYHIQNLNNYHKQMKQFFSGFNGVSTKYLDHYLAWHNMVNYTGSPDEQTRHTLTNFLYTTNKKIRRADVTKRPPVPS